MQEYPIIKFNFKEGSTNIDECFDRCWYVYQDLQPTVPQEIRPLLKLWAKMNMDKAGSIDKGSWNEYYMNLGCADYKIQVYMSITSCEI